MILMYEKTRQIVWTSLIFIKFLFKFDSFALVSVSLTFSGNLLIFTMNSKSPFALSLQVVNFSKLLSICGEVHSSHVDLSRHHPVKFALKAMVRGQISTVYIV